MSWLSGVISDAKAKLADHPGAPTEGQLAELVHMLEALGVTVEGKLKAAAPAVVSVADAPAQAVAKMVEDAVAAAKTELSGSLADLFKTFADKQVAAVEELRQELGGLSGLQALVQQLGHLGSPNAAAATSAAPAPAAPAAPQAPAAAPAPAPAA